MGPLLLAVDLGCVDETVANGPLGRSALVLVVADVLSEQGSVNIGIGMMGKGRVPECRNYVRGLWDNVRTIGQMKSVCKRDGPGI